MSRVGAMPIIIPDNVKINLEGSRLILSNSCSCLCFVLNSAIECVISDKLLVLSFVGTSNKSRVLWGTVRSIVNNLVTGLAKGFSCYLDVFGVGYKVEANNKYLTLSLGFSHSIKYKIPEGIKIKCLTNQIEVTGYDKQKIYMIASDICKVRKYDPYKGKGIVIRGKDMLRKEANKKK